MSTNIALFLPVRIEESLAEFVSRFQGESEPLSVEAIRDALPNMQHGVMFKEDWTHSGEIIRFKSIESDGFLLEKDTPETMDMDIRGLIVFQDDKYMYTFISTMQMSHDTILIQDVQDSFKKRMRESFRMVTHRPCSVISDKKEMRGVIRDIGDGGMRITIQEAQIDNLHIDKKIRILIPFPSLSVMGTLNAVVKRWSVENDTMILGVYVEDDDVFYKTRHAIKKGYP